jgi:hypothetical protein
MSTVIPAAAMTYDNLTSNTLQYLERQDPAVVNQIPTFIMLAEFEIAEMMKSLGQQQVAQGVMTIGNPVIPKPARWRKTTSFNVTVNGKVQPVFLRKYEYLRNYSPSGSNTGVPLYYADYDYDNWLISPAPDAAYPFEVLYYERIQPLSSENQTNWVTRNAPNAMLYGTLLQAMPFLKNDQRQIFQQKYTEAITALSNEDKLRIADRQAIAQDS